MTTGTTADGSTEPIATEVEELARWRRRLAIRVPSGRASAVRRRAVRALAAKARLKGFRQGKAPERLIERQYGPEIDQEVLEDLVREGIAAGLEETGLDPIAMPEIEGVRWNAEGGLEFSAEFDIRPKIELGRTGGFRLEKTMRPIGEEDVDRVLERLCHERGEWHPTDAAAAAGHRVTFDSVPLDAAGLPIDGERIEDHKVELGSSTLLPDFETGLMGRAAGAEASFEVRFPDDHPNEALRGVARTFRVAIRAVEERVLPELDDDFAHAIGGFGSLAEAREHIRENLAAESDLQAERDLNEALIDEIIAANPFDLPESMVDRYLDAMMSDREGPLGGRVPAERETEMRKLLRPGAERAMRRHTILTHIADGEGLRADDASLEQAIAERIDPSKTSVPAARRQLERAGQLDDLRFHVTLERVFGWLRERSTITSVEEER